MSLPYYKRFPRDYLDACVGMPFELRAGYGMILDLIYLKDGRLPLDKPWIAGHLGCSVRMVSKIIDGLIDAKKLHVSDGLIRNYRADKVLEETRKYRDKQSEIAARPRKNNDLRQPETSQSESDTESERKSPPLSPKGEKKARRRATTIPDGFPDLEALKVGRDMVVEAGVNVHVRTEADKFRDYAAGRDWKKVDWLATWRNWVRSACERGKPLGIVINTPEPDYDPWPYRLRCWRGGDWWNDVDWGPEPGMPGCRVPPHHLKLEAAE